MVYMLELLMKINMIHPIFHVSILRKSIGDPNSLVPLEDVSIEENLIYEDDPANILNWQVKRMRNKELHPLEYFGGINKLKVKRGKWKQSIHNETIFLSFTLYSSPRY